MAGTANRRLSERYKIWVWLCHDCHTGTEGAQYNKERNYELKRQAQIAFEEVYSHEEWMRAFGKNYIW